MVRQKHLLHDTASAEGLGDWFTMSFSDIMSL